MFKFSIIEKLNLTFNFGGDKKIEVASGKQSEGVIVLSSPLETKAIDLSKNASIQSNKKIRVPKK